MLGPSALSGAERAAILALQKLDAISPGDSAPGFQAWPEIDPVPEEDRLSPETAMPHEPHDPLTDEDLENFDAARAERESEEALARGTELPSTGLLSFYDRLREAIFKVVEKRGGKLSEGTIRALMLVPDVFILLVRLALDKEVPGSSRALIGGAIAYFILPFDLLPEAILGPAGYLDDLVLATAVLAQAFGGD